MGAHQGCLLLRKSGLEMRTSETNTSMSESPSSVSSPHPSHATRYAVPRTETHPTLRSLRPTLLRAPQAFFLALVDPGHGARPILGRTERTDRADMRGHDGQGPFWEGVPKKPMHINASIDCKLLGSHSNSNTCPSSTFAEVQSTKLESLARASFCLSDCKLFSKSLSCLLHLQVRSGCLSRPSERTSHSAFVMLHPASPPWGFSIRRMMDH